jgi:hypothetical protein
VRFFGPSSTKGIRVALFDNPGAHPQLENEVHMMQVAKDKDLQLSGEVDPLTRVGIPRCVY